MHILILGAAGMVGRKLFDRLVRDGRLGGETITRFTLHDVVAPEAPAGTGVPVSLSARTSRCRARPNGWSPPGRT